jgi:OFA family oxalate/formate antiporter-like MFS transporter
MVVILAAALPMQFPGTLQHPVLLSVPEIVVRPAFRILYIAMVTGLAAGFAVNANLKELSASATAETAIAAVSLFAVANGVGRIVWGYVADRVTVTWAVIANLFFQSTVFGLSAFLLEGRYGIVAFALLTGFNYGGVLVVYASSVARLWGAERVGQVYGLLFSANILASPAPIFAGWAYDATGEVQPALMALLVLMVSAVILTLRGRKMLDPVRSPEER